jgi:hypothetical protein
MPHEHSRACHQAGSRITKKTQYRGDLPAIFTIQTPTDPQTSQETQPLPPEITTRSRYAFRAIEGR